MTNIAIELIVLALGLVHFGVILTAEIYSRSVKEIELKRLFCIESISNPYFIV